MIFAFFRANFLFFLKNDNFFSTDDFVSAAVTHTQILGFYQKEQIDTISISRQPFLTIGNDLCHNLFNYG